MIHGQLDYCNSVL